MNYYNPHQSNQSFNRPAHYQQNYHPQYSANHIPPLQRMSQMSQISHMSQQYANLSNVSQYDSRQPQYNIFCRNSLSMINNSGNSNSFLFQGQNNSNQAIIQKNMEQERRQQVDISTLLSPILLKAYSFLEQHQYQPEKLQRIEHKLKQQLNKLRKLKQVFKNRMEQLLSFAQQKYRTTEMIVLQKMEEKKAYRAKSLDSYTKKHIKPCENSKSMANLDLTKVKRKRGRPKKVKMEELL